MDLTASLALPDPDIANSSYCKYLIKILDDVSVPLHSSKDKNPATTFDLTSTIGNLESAIGELHQIKESKSVAKCTSEEPQMTQHPQCDHLGFTVNYDQTIYPLLNAYKKLYQSSQIVECTATLSNSLIGSIISKWQGRLNYSQLSTIRSLRFLQDSCCFESLTIESLLNNTVAKFEECHISQDIISASYYLKFPDFYQYLSDFIDKSTHKFDTEGSDFDTFADKLNEYLVTHVTREFQHVGAASPITILVYNVVGDRILKKVKFELRKCIDDYTKLRALFSYTQMIQNSSMKLTFNIPYFRCFSEVIKNYSKILQSELQWKDLEKLKTSKFYELIDLMRIGMYLGIINDRTDIVRYFENSSKRILTFQERILENQSLEGLLKSILLMNSGVNMVYIAKAIFSNGFMKNLARGTYFEVVLDQFFADFDKKISKYTTEYLDKLIQKMETILKQQRKVDFKPNDASFDGSGSKVAVQICEDFRSVKNQLPSLPNATKIFLLTSAVIEFIRMYILHIHKFKYNSLGTLVLIKDIYSYSELINDETKLSDFLWQVLLSIANLILVKPENIRSLLTDGNLAFFDSRLLEEFTFLKEDSNRVDTHPISSLLFIL